MDPKLHFRHKPVSGYTRMVGPGEGELEFLEVGILRLDGSQVFESATDGQEAALTLLSGRCSAEVEGNRWEGLYRRDPFRDWDKCTTVYIPIGSSYRVEADGPVEIAVSKAATDFKGEPRLIGPEEVATRVVGRGQTWQWEINLIIPQSFAAGRLLLGEDLTMPGNWASYPPHKHDEDRPPEEARKEEVFLYKVDPPQGFGIQRVYTADGSFDEAYVVKDNDCVALPWGHHPAVAGGGYRLFFVWAMARGDQEGTGVVDPEHVWMLPG
jgi:5-deoxy-glucuronate isomerase